MISIHPKKTDPNFPYPKKFVIFPWPDLEMIAEKTLQHVWSPIVWKDGTRGQKNFIHSYYMVLDFDDGSPTLAEAIKKYGHYQHIIATTKSHQKPKGKKGPCDRFRLIVPFLNPIEDRTHYAYNMSIIARKSGADTSAADCSRIFQPSIKIESMKTQGICATIRPIPKEKPTKRNVSWWNHPVTGRLRSTTIAFLESGQLFHNNERNNTLYRVALDLLRHGWTPDRIKAEFKSRVDLSDWEINDIVSRSGLRDYRVLPFPNKLANKG